MKIYRFFCTKCSPYFIPFNQVMKLKINYQLQNYEMNEFTYFQSIGSKAYKLHYFEVCFTVPFFLLLTYECFNHLHTFFGKFVLTLLSILWLIKGSDLFWKSKIHCFNTKMIHSQPNINNDYQFLFDIKNGSLLINQEIVQHIYEFYCLQSCMVLYYNNHRVLIPWRIFDKDEIKTQFIRYCIQEKKKTSKLNYTHKQA